MRAWLAALVLLAPPLVAAAAPPELKVGDLAPELGAAEFVGTPPVTISALRGNVTACVFLRTADPGTADQVKFLCSYFKVNSLRSLYFIGLTDEPREKVDAFVAEHSPNFPMAIVSADAAAAYGVKEWPAAFLISTDGKIAWKGTWAQFGDGPYELIDELTKKGQKLPYLTGALEPSRKLYDNCKYVEARARLTAIAANATTAEPVRAAAQDAVRWIDFNAGAHLLAAQWREKFEGYLTGVFHYRLVIDLHKGLDAANAAQKAIDAILADPERKREVTADEKCREVYFAWEDSRSGSKPMTPAQKTKAISTLKSIVINYKGTKGAKDAEELIAEIEKSAK